MSDIMIPVDSIELPEYVMVGSIYRTTDDELVRYVPERTCTFQWVEFDEGDEGWCCSNCWEIGYEIEIESYYCPNCGAKVVSE